MTSPMPVHRDAAEADSDLSAAAAESQRIAAEHQRRQTAVPSDLYQPWQPSVILGRASRKRHAAILLQRAGAFPRTGDLCCEIGCGSLGWLGDLITWGARERDLYGIDLSPARVAQAREALPLAHLAVGDATQLPYANNTFALVIASTVFTSILDAEVRRKVAAEICRALAPGGALLWYDFAVNNPRNPHVRKVTRTELRELFPTLKGTVRSLTLAPPLARWTAPRSWLLACFLEAIPFLHTHLLAVLVKQP
jgi:ubiquinone/menaquinone biosynthesis C-methylase UbiE